MTTDMDRLHGGIEVNGIVDHLMSAGGPAALVLVKFGLVAVMAVMAVVALRYRRDNPGSNANIVVACLSRSIQICALCLTLVAFNNTLLLATLIG